MKYVYWIIAACFCVVVHNGCVESQYLYGKQSMNAQDEIKAIALDVITHKGLDKNNMKLLYINYVSRSREWILRYQDTSSSIYVITYTVRVADKEDHYAAIVFKDH